MSLILAIGSNCPRVFADILSSHAAVGLGKNLFPLFARALDLAPDFFDDKVSAGRVCSTLVP